MQTSTKIKWRDADGPLFLPARLLHGHTHCILRSRGRSALRGGRSQDQAYSRRSRLLRDQPARSRSGDSHRRRRGHDRECGETYTQDKGASRLAYLDRYLAGRDYLLDRFSVADAYLFTVLNWSTATGVDLARWPAVKDYYTRMRQRPSIAKALAEERALYVQQQA